LSARHLARDLAVAGVAVAAALLVGGLLVWAVGDSPLFFYALVAESAFGSLEGVGYTVFYATPLICTGLSVAVAYRCGLLNIGAEGQMVMGALAAGAAALAMPATPGENGGPDQTTPVAVLVALLLGVAAAAAWGAIPGWLRARFGAHEVIVTIMLNAIAAAIAGYFTIRYLRKPGDQILESALIPEGARLPRAGALLPFLPERIPVNLTLAIALLAAAGVALFLWRTRWGFAVRAVGANADAAAHSRIPVGRQIVLAMTIAGALAGLAGVNETLGFRYRYYHDFSPGYGYTGIAVALLGRSHPLGVVLAALLFGALTRASLFVDIFTDHVSREIMLIIQGLVVLFVACEGWLSAWLAARRIAA
jgi:general nucleoside transport system permease protein